MDNLLAGILVSSLKRAKIPWLSRVSYRYQQPISGVAGFTGMGGRFQTEWVAGFHRNRWPVWTGILKRW
jgi:nitrogenase molybdenum-iron protein alpha/beta subunit